MVAQSAGPITIDTPLGDQIAFHSMGGLEGLSRLFVYDIDVLSARADVSPGDLLGHSVTVHLQRTGNDQGLRHWNGRITGFQYVGTGDDGFSRYRLRLHPWLWSLTRSSDCRIFQNMRVPDVITKVFHDRGFTDFDHALFESYAPREYVVQYRETDFDFVARLMQREGIYYFFRHEAHRHTLVLTDSPSAHGPAAGSAQLGYAPPDAHRDDTREYVRQWRALAELATSKFAHADYEFTRPRVRLYSTRTTPGGGGPPDPEVYDYPGGFSTFPAGAAIGQVRLEQHRTGTRAATGETNGRGLAAGNTFRLVDHPREDQNREYLVIGARYRLRGQELRSAGDADQHPFSCSFRVIPAGSTFRARAAARKPIVLGPQTAVVVGPTGQEIWTDQFGRVKVQFHWDREGHHDENSSCFVRVCQAWAGSGWGAQFIPRIGQEVIVDFIEGDPDRPLITGSVYNGANAPPFKLPHNQTQSGIRTRSTPNGTQTNGNEIRFEDLKGREDLFIQAEGTQTTVIKRDQSVSVGGNRVVEIVGGETETIGLIRATQILGANSLTIAGDSSERVGGALHTFVGGDRVESVSSSAVSNVVKNSLLEVGGVVRADIGDSLRVASGGAESRTIAGTLEVRIGDLASYVYAADVSTVVGHPDRQASTTSDVYGTSLTRASGDLVIQSDSSIVLMCGNTKIELTPDGITVGGNKIALGGGSEIDITSPSASLKLDANATIVGTVASVSGSGSSLTLDTQAKLVGAKVSLGSGSGQSASASADAAKGKDPAKPVFIRISVLRAGKPAAGVAYTLVLDGKLERSGSTTGAGLVEQQVPATVATAVLTLHDTGETKTFAIGAIEPAHTVLGAQLRLQRLGFYHGAIDGSEGTLMTRALGAFQKAKGLTATGKLDGSTASALESAYGS